jgi:hypothetical protein
MWTPLDLAEEFDTKPYIISKMLKIHQIPLSKEDLKGNVHEQFEYLISDIPGLFLSYCGKQELGLINHSA